MFDYIINKSEKSRDHFSESVHDSVGTSINNEVYTTIITQEYELRNSYNEAQEKINRINNILAQARAIT